MLIVACCFQGVLYHCSQEWILKSILKTKACRLFFFVFSRILGEATSKFTNLTVPRKEKTGDKTGKQEIMKAFICKELGVLGIISEELIFYPLFQLFMQKDI